MQTNELARLNRILGDSLGRNPQGDPIYKWIWSRDLTFPMRSGTKTTTQGGLVIFDHDYTMEPQVSDECWLLAKWCAPCSPSEWLGTFGGEVGFPSNGLYYTTDVMLKAGVEPNEAVTYDCIGKVKHLRNLTVSQILEAQKDKMSRSEKRSDDRVADFIADKATAFGNVPGKRGGATSFGGV